MADETRRLLKVFGVAVTDFEAEAEKLEAAAAQPSTASGKDQIGKLLKDVTELCRELNTRWLETTQHIFATQNRLLSRLADAAAVSALSRSSDARSCARLHRLCRRAGAHRLPLASCQPAPAGLAPTHRLASTPAPIAPALLRN